MRAAAAAGVRAAAVARAARVAASSSEGGREVAVPAALGGNTDPKIPPKLCKNGATLFLFGIQSLASLGFFSE